MSAPYTKPLPAITPLFQGFWAHARAGELAMQVCSQCSDMHFPASPQCPRCMSTEQHWRVVSGRAKLVSWVDFHHAYWDGYKQELPYRVCLVRLDEGPLLISNLIGGSESPALDAPVRVVFDAVTEEVTLPKFTLVAPEAAS